MTMIVTVLTRHVINDPFDQSHIPAAEMLLCLVCSFVWFGNIMDERTDNMGEYSDY